jgi:hypothetical protein
VDFANFAGVMEDAFGEQESGGQLEVVAGGPHGEGDGLFAEADFEWFFDGQKILNGS